MIFGLEVRQLSWNGQREIMKLATLSFLRAKFSSFQTPLTPPDPESAARRRMHDAASSMEEEKLTKPGGEKRNAPATKASPADFYRPGALMARDHALAFRPDLRSGLTRA